jgi:formylglycine-generating enzyme required for sulfatase activity
MHTRYLCSPLLPKHLMALSLLVWLSPGHSAGPSAVGGPAQDSNTAQKSASPDDATAAPNPAAPSTPPAAALARHPSTGAALNAKDQVAHPRGLGPKMLVLPRAPAEGFMMGSPESEAGRDNRDETQHWVTIPYVFAMSQTHVTFDDWAACVKGGGCKSNPYPRSLFGKGRMPVIRITHADAMQYVAWLNSTIGIRTANDTLWPYRYRLPTEIETEYATRADNTGPFGFAKEGGLEPNVSPERANYDWRSSYQGSPTKPWLGETKTVGSYAPNAYGLYDMAGNVWAWQADCYSPTYNKTGQDPKPSSYQEEDSASGRACAQRTLRGGSWNDGARDLRSANRSGSSPKSLYSDVGLRLTRALPAAN